MYTIDLLDDEPEVVSVPEVESEDEEFDEEPEPDPVGVLAARRRKRGESRSQAVTFRCEQWAGVRLHGTGIKFEDHHYATSDPGEIERLDAWPHAERVSE